MTSRDCIEKRRKRKCNLKKNQARPLSKEKQHRKTLFPVGHKQQTITKAKSLQKLYHPQIKGGLDVKCF